MRIAGGATALAMEVGVVEHDVGIAGIILFGSGTLLLTVGIVLAVTMPPSFRDTHGARPLGEHFAIDDRPEPVTPRYWLGEL